MARVALDKLKTGTDEKDFYETKLAVARFYMARLLPQHTSLAAAMIGGTAPIMGLAEAAY